MEHNKTFANLRIRVEMCIEWMKTDTYIRQQDSLIEVQLMHVSRSEVKWVQTALVQNLLEKFSHVYIISFFL